MAVYTYVAKDEKGVTVSGTYTDVEDTNALRDELDKMGYVLVKARRGRRVQKGHRKNSSTRLSSSSSAILDSAARGSP